MESATLNTLKKKPGALASSVALQQAQTKIKKIYNTYYTSRPKEFVELMQFMQDGASLEEIEQSIQELRQIHPHKVTTNKIKVLCAKNRETISLLIALSQETKDMTEMALQHLKMYDELFDTQTFRKSGGHRMSHSPRKAWAEAIMEYSKELKLPMIRQYLANHVDEALQKDVSYEEFLALLLQKECDARQEASRQNRIRLADFPYKKYLEDLKVQELPEDGQKKLKLLKTLDFIKEGRNVLLCGTAGTGNYRKNLVVKRKEYTSRYINDCALISFHNSSE